MIEQYDVCCIGHITNDVVITADHTRHMAGGTAWYFSHAIRSTAASFALVTAVGKTEQSFVEELRACGTRVFQVNTDTTVCFENRYGQNSDQRTQRVTRLADPFSLAAMPPVSASIYHLGPLLARDIPFELLSHLSKKGRLSLDVQGFLRDVRDERVYPVAWPRKDEILPLIHTLKVNEEELYTLTGESSVPEGVRSLSNIGIQEIVITLGSAGSVVVQGDNYYEIAACDAVKVVDVTGCGDTYMAAYLGSRARGLDVPTSGAFASKIAGLKVERWGPSAGIL